MRLTKAERAVRNAKRDECNRWILARMIEILGYNPEFMGESEERSQAHEQAFNEWHEYRRSRI